MQQWNQFCTQLDDILRAMECTNELGQNLPISQALGCWQKKALDLKYSRNTLFFVGNGASASMASHFSADVNKNAGIHTQVFTDAALLTAVANDLDYSRVFSEPLSRCALAGDMLVTISSSGNSPNILRTIDMALSMGLHVVTLSAMKADNASRKRGHCNIYLPAPTYGLAETAHAALLHHWTDMLVDTAQHTNNP